MRKITGYILIILGVLLGLYVGVWVLFIGGIFGIISAITDIVDGLGADGWLIGVSIAKMLFASFVGWVSGLILVLPGIKLISK